MTTSQSPTRDVPGETRDLAGEDGTVPGRIFSEDEMHRRDAIRSHHRRRADRKARKGKGVAAVRRQS